MKKVFYGTLILMALLGSGILLFQSSYKSNMVHLVLAGGSYTDAQEKAYIKPFSQKYNIDYTISSTSSNLAEIQTQAMSNSPGTIDVISMTAGQSTRACNQGLLHRFNVDRSQYIKGAVAECAIASTIYSTVIVTRPSKTSIRNAQDFFDPSIPGQRGLKRKAKSTLELALMGAGVPKDQIYQKLKTEKGIQMAFEQLNKIKDRIIWWEYGAQASQLLASGQVVAAAAYNGRIGYLAEEEGFTDTNILWDTQIMNFVWFTVPKKAPNKENAIRFVKFATSHPHNGYISKYIPYSPVTKQQPKSLTKYYSTHPDNIDKGIKNNGQFWVNNRSRLEERFSNWLAN